MKCILFLLTFITSCCASEVMLLDKSGNKMTWRTALVADTAYLVYGDDDDDTTKIELKATNHRSGKLIVDGNEIAWPNNGKTTTFESKNAAATVLDKNDVITAVVHDDELWYQMTNKKGVSSITEVVAPPHSQFHDTVLTLDEDDDQNTKARHLSIDMNNPQKGRSLVVERWVDCFPGGDEPDPTIVQIGNTLTSEMRKRFNSIEETIAWVDDTYATSNIVFTTQINLKLTIAELIIAETDTRSVYPWNNYRVGNNNECEIAIDTQLFALRDWRDDRVPFATWHTFDDCFVGPSGTIGIAYLRTLCYHINQPNVNAKSRGYNTGVTWYTNQNTWVTWAHEIGHNIGAEHSFEEGQGSTGGIMDYGDGKLNGEYQFNTQYRREEICSTLTGAINNLQCPYMFLESGTSAPSPQTNSPTNSPTPPQPTSSPTNPPTTTRSPTKTPTNSPTPPPPYHPTPCLPYNPTSCLPYNPTHCLPHKPTH
jgi:hypothetical protein